jgi:CSLREA domain-containing protein
MSTRKPKPISSCALGRIIPSLLLAVLLLAGAAIAPLPAHAASIVVNDAGDTTGTCSTTGTGTCTLRDAITYANNTAGADTITFSISNATIALGSTLPTVSEDLTIDGTGQNITIDGQNNVQIMRTGLSSLTLNVTELRLVRGNLSSGGASGGAIEVNNEANLNVTGCTFDGNNSAVAGGAIYAAGVGTLTVTNSTFSSNFANGQNGGAIWTGKETTNISNSTFTTNRAVGGGGAIFNSGVTLNVSNSTFDRNFTTGSVGGGGAIDNNSGTANVANSTFSGNYTAGSSGGGAIYNYTFAYLNVTNSTLSGNYISSGTGTGGGIHYDTTTTSDRMTLKNTIIANSTSGGDCVGTAAAGSNNNLIEDGSNACGLTDGTSGNIVGTDPNLGALASNSGPTQTMGPNVGSAAIDAGDDTVCAAPPVSNLDQRGITRPKGAHCDIGAVERQNPTAVQIAGFAAQPVGLAEALAQWVRLLSGR